MLTESEAKELWCPQARVTGLFAVREGEDHVFAGNRIGEPWVAAPHGIRHASCCIASGCMSWRWDMEWESATEEGVGGDLVLRLKRRAGEPKRGYCGLAGKP